MRVITEVGLRKHLDEKVIAGDDEKEIFNIAVEKEGPGEIGTLLEDNLGFYIQINKVRSLELSHVKRINTGDIIAIIYPGKPWRTYYVDLF